MHAQALACMYPVPHLGDITVAGHIHTIGGSREAKTGLSQWWTQECVGLVSRDFLNQGLDTHLEP